MEHVDIEYHLKLSSDGKLYSMVVPFQVINIRQQDQLKSRDLKNVFKMCIMGFLEKFDCSGIQQPNYFPKKLPTSTGWHPIRI